MVQNIINILKKDNRKYLEFHIRSWERLTLEMEYESRRAKQLVTSRDLK